MKFEKFTGQIRKHYSKPQLMQVGQIVVRENVSRTYRNHLEQTMKYAALKGMEFSVALEGSKYAIRRDK